MSPASEFDIIEREFLGAGFPSHAAVKVGPGDDCAIFVAESGQDLCVSIDTLVSGVHFPAGASGAVVASRALMTNLSDLAAMGASPLLFVIALTIPDYDPVWTHEFAAALREGAERYGIALAGGDLTRGPLSVTLQVTGQVPAGGALLRSGARLHDDLYVSGTIGDAMLGLRIAAGATGGAGGDGQFLLARFVAPTPRVELGMALRGIAHAAIDLSDGLLQDAEHIARASGVGAEIRLAELPLSGPLMRALGREAGERHALTAGDDYELCFAAPRTHRSRIVEIGEEVGVAIARIGAFTGGPGIRCLDRDGGAIDLPRHGYQHF